MVKLYVEIGVFEVTEQHATVSFDVTIFVEPLNSVRQLLTATDSVNTPILTHFMHITISHHPDRDETSIRIPHLSYPPSPDHIHPLQIPTVAHIHPLEASIAPLIKAYFTHRYLYCHIIDFY